MPDAKDARYFPCPKCNGAKFMDCPVCHGFGTITEECYLFGARFGKECVWSKPVAQVAEEFANASEGEPEPPELNEFLEPFVPGDLVVWHEKPWEMPFAGSGLHQGTHETLGEIYRDMADALRLAYGNGPFRVIAVDYPISGDSDEIPRLILADTNDDRSPHTAPRMSRPIAATWFVKLFDS